MKYALNYREVKLIVMQRLIKIDGKKRSDARFPVGLFDVISIEKTKEHFRLMYNTKRKFDVTKISEEEAQYKLCRVNKFKWGPQKTPIIYTNDRRTFRFIDPLIKVNDTVRMDIETGKIIDFIKFKVGQVAYINGGHSCGRVGVIQSVTKHEGTFDMVLLQDAAGNTFTTRLGNVFVIGDGETPWITLPKGNGIKLSSMENREIVLARHANRG